MSDYCIKETLDRRIFRAYDIRGTCGAQLDESVFYTIGRGLSTHLMSQKVKRMIVARDGRLSSPSFAKALIAGLIDSGIDVVEMGMSTSPLLYFAVATSSCNSGVIITGSHNPKDDNGLKIVVSGQSLSQMELLSIYDIIVQKNFITGVGNLIRETFYEDYVNAINSRVKLNRKLKVVIDCGNGSSGVIARDVFTALGAEVIILNETIDGNFPNHDPDPSVIENLALLQKTVVDHQASLGLAFDGDADRIGVVDERGDIIFSDQLLMLLAEHLLETTPNARIVYDIKCTRELPKWIKSLGGDAILSPTGHSLVKAKMKDIEAHLAGEMSGHIFYKDRWFGFDDGVYTGARLLELLSRKEETLSQLMSRFPKMVSTPEIKLPIAAQEKFSTLEKIKMRLQELKTDVITVDGIKVDFPEGWALIRASNTTECLTCRFEAIDKPHLMKLIELFNKTLSEFSLVVSLTGLSLADEADESLITV